MKSTSQGTSMWRMRSREEEHGALEHADQQQVLARRSRARSPRPARRTRCWSSSAWTRISPMDSSRGAPARRESRRRGLRGGVATNSQAAVARSLARSPPPTSSAPCSAERRGSRPCGGRPPGRRPRRRAAATTSRASAGGSARRSASAGGSPASASTASTAASSTAASSRSSSTRAQDVGLGGGVELAQRRHEPVARAVAGEGVGSRWSGPRATAGRARRTTPRSPRARRRAAGGRPALARRACRAARAGRARPRAGRARSRPGRRRCGRRRRRRRARRQPRRLGVADVARPGLEVALGAARAVDVERHAEPRAQRLAVRGVLGGRVAQAVVDVQRASPRRPTRTARSSRQTESRPPESSTSTGAPAAAGPSARTRASRLTPAAREEQLRGLAEALELDLADVLELEVRAGRPRRAAA